MHYTESEHSLALKEELVDAIKFLYSKGWAPATSSNYSFRVPNQHLFWISKSGVDKAHFTTDNLMLIDETGNAVMPNSPKSSAETLLHTMLYERAETQSVLHTHSINNTILSLAHEKENGILLKGFELQKGLEGVKSHEEEIWIPIFSNSQNIDTLANEIRKFYNENQQMKAFLLAGHGLYTWGTNISIAKRQIETLEFLFDCTIKLKIYGNSTHTR